MRFILCSLLAASTCMVGCGDLLSLHALYTKDSQVFDPSIEGKWENAENSMVVTRMGDYYEVLLQGRPAHGDPTKFELHLLDIEGVRFADIEGADQVGHMILRVRHEGAKIQLAFMDSKWLLDTVAHDTADIERGAKQAILTVPTPQVKNLIAKYAREEKSYDKEIVFSRP